MCALLYVGGYIRVFNMYSLVIWIGTVLSLLVFGYSLQPKIGIGAVFESLDYNHYNGVFYRTLEENQRIQNVNQSVNGRAIPVGDDLFQTIQGLCSFIKGRDIRSLLVVGKQRTIHSVSLVANPMGIPVLGYTTDMTDKFVQIHNPLFLMLKPSKRDQAQAFIHFFQANFWFNIILFVQKSFIVDGFYNAMTDVTASDTRWNVRVEIVSERISKWELSLIVTSLLGSSPQIVVLHTKVGICKRIFEIVRESNFSHINHAWFLTELSYTRDLDDMHVIPTGTLSIVPNYVVHTDDIVVDGTNLLLKALTSLSPTEKKLIKRDCFSHPTAQQTLSGDVMYRRLINTQLSGLSGDIQFDEQGQLTSYNFLVQNLVQEQSQIFWRKIGHIKGDDVSPFGIIWPGESLSNNGAEGKKRYRIVTNPVKPFVIAKEPHPDYDDCSGDTVCISINSTSKELTINAVRDYEKGIIDPDNPYDIFCCRGLSIDLLNRLASDLDFEYTLYIVSDRTYGKFTNGSWNGIIRDLMSGTAHMAVAAMSITRSRVKVIDFTAPYFFSGFSVLYTEKRRDSNMRAFLEPFGLSVWFAILISATLTAIAMGLFEWNSPFGLNPWGKKRKQNYTLASGTTMVYSVLFGHTVKTKSPKAWPSKVMQNFWAFASIFIIASYTANLAAFIAGKHAGITYHNIYDSRLLDIRVGVLGGSAVEGVVKIINPRLYQMTQRYLVPSTDTAIQSLIEENLDAYLGDYPILDYARVKLDPECDLRLLTQTFGEDGYGIGLPKGSPLKLPVSKTIQGYHESGYIDDLIDVHFADSNCYKQRIKEEDSRLEVLHHAGSFTMLCVGIIAGVGILFLEQGVFRWLVPKLRQRPGNSIWKSVHLMFFSQRFHRSITSAELVSATETCREMMTIIKNREIARLFQKSTIRTNKLADMAKKKRLNRNFFDIVEKAKWMQEMQDNNLFGDDSTPTSPAPKITEISLKDISSAVDLNEFRRQQREELSRHKLTKEKAIDDNTELPEWLSKPSEPLSSHDNTIFEGDTETASCARDISPGESLISRGLLECHDNSICDRSAEGKPFYARSVSENQPSFDLIQETVESDNDKLSDASCTKVSGDDRSYTARGEHYKPLPNGDLFADSYRPLGIDETMSTNRCLLSNRSNAREVNLTRRSSLPNQQAKTGMLDSRKKRKSFYDKAGSRLDKTDYSFNIDQFTKEELLCMWKSKELELNARLKEAVRDKEKLEHKLAGRHFSTPV